MAIVLRLTDEERAELERRRAAGGFRSLNETVKVWLRPPPNLQSDVPIVTAARVVTAAKGQGPTSGTATATLPRESPGASIGRPAPKPGSLLKKR